MVCRSHSDNLPHPTYFHFRMKDGVGALQIFLEVYGRSTKQMSLVFSLISPFFPLSKPIQLCFLLDFHYFNVLHGVSVPVTVRARGSLVL